MAHTLIIAGAQRSGTTSVAEWFASSPYISSVGVECLAFEGRRLRRKTKRLRRQTSVLESAGSMALIKRPEIFHNPTICDRALDAFPEASVIVILRHPIERTVSAWLHYRRMGHIAPDLRLRDCATAWHYHRGTVPAGQIIAYSRYSCATEHMLNRADNPLFVFYEEVTDDPATALSPALENLGLKSEFTRPLPMSNSASDGARLGPHPSRVAGQLAYRWDARNELLVRRNLAARSVAITIANLGSSPTPPVYEDDLIAIQEVVAADLSRLEEALERKVPDYWHSLRITR